MTPHDVATLLKQRIGIDASIVGQSAIDHAIRARMADCGSGSTKEYSAWLGRSEAEVEKLIEAVVVPETWFFRNKEAFAALADFVSTESRSAHPSGPMRVLSVPCSTGEEPYSIAMALLTAGHAQFRIDAVDISAAALAKAARATYGRNSFRGTDHGYRDRFFARTAQGYELAEAVRERVRFARGNLMATNLLADAPAYDIIFCRNVLIYFDSPTQQEVLTRLRRGLADDGLLFVGAAEALLARNCGFTPARYAAAFAFHKVGAPAPVALARPPASPRCSIPIAARRKTARIAPVQHPAKPAVVVAPAAFASDLGHAQALADAGRLAEARKACENHLREHGPSGAAHYLLGLVCDSLGDERLAAASYRKAIYLEPDHAEALLHLALLEQKHGDGTAARRLRDRARRSAEAAKP